MRCSFWMLFAAAVLGAPMPFTGQGTTPSASRTHPSAPADAAKRETSTKFAGEAVVVERWATVYRYNADGTGTKVDTEVIAPQTDAGARALAVLSVPYAAARERVEVVYVRVRKRNGAVIPTPPGEAQDEETPMTRAAPSYSDVHLLRLGVRGLAAGDRLEYEVRTVFTAPQAKDAFWGFELLPAGRVVEERTVELRVPGGTHLAVGSQGARVETRDEAGVKVYRWTASQMVPTGKVGTASAAQTNLQAGLAGGGEPQRLAWSTFPSWAAVGEWYRGQMLDRTAVTPAIKAKADDVVYRARSADAKLVALYDYLASEVRSIDVPLGTGGYQPQAAAEVFANQYGDSQDKHALLAAMLRAEKLPEAAVLVGGAEDLDETVPAPFWFERVLTLSHDSEHGDVWLDPTPEFAPFRMLQQDLRGKLALVIPDTGMPELRRTPADAPFPEYTHFSAAGTLTAEGALQAHMDLVLRGDEEMRFREGLHTGGPANWDQVAAYYVRRAGLTGEASHTTAEGLESAEAPLHLGFDYDRESYGDWENFRIAPLEPGMNLRLTDRVSAPAGDFSLGGKRTETAVSRLTLPAGFGAELPPVVHVETPFAALDKTYRLERAEGAEVLVTDRTLLIKQDSLPASAWPEYRMFLVAAGKSEPPLQLTSLVAHTGPGHFPPSAGENNTAAAALVAQANQAVMHGDWDTAQARLDQAKALNPRQALLWRTYAGVAQGRGKPDEAMADDAHELKEHPAESDVSRHLAALLVRAGRTGEAVTVMRAAMAANPGDQADRRALTDLLLRSDPSAAEAMLRGALAASPGSLGVKLELGRVLLKEGKRDEAAGLLAAVAQGSDDAEELNDAAYELAQANLNAKAAEAAARHALQLMNASSRGLSGATGTEALLRSAQLISAWDTYGWLLYQEGSTSEAEPWLHAAWADSFGAAAGAHYSKLLAKQGRGAEAARVQALAAKGEQGTVDEATESIDHVDRVTTVARRKTSATQLPAGGGTDGERSFAVPRAEGGPAGSAIFDLDYALMTPTGVRFVRGDGALAGMAEAVARVETQTLIPPGSAGHLVRRGELVCVAGGSCRMRIFSPMAALAP